MPESAAAEGGFGRGSPARPDDNNGETLVAQAGDTAAADRFTFRETAVSGANHGPFCMIGACFDCLVEIDGEPNRSLHDPGRRRHVHAADTRCPLLGSDGRR